MIDIMILDDDRAFLQLLEDFLPVEDFATRTFNHSEAALASLRDQLPQVLVLDLMMPQHDGVAIYNELRAAPATATLPIIISTAASQHLEKLKDQAHDPRVRVLLKPYPLARLIAQINELAQAFT